MIANGENLAHGIGVTMPTVSEMYDAGVDILTTGNHVFKKKDCIQVFANFSNKIVRPANFPGGSPGRGYTTFKVGEQRICVINLNGRVFLKEDFEDPFRILPVRVDLLSDRIGDVRIIGEKELIDREAARPDSIFPLARRI